MNDIDNILKELDDRCLVNADHDCPSSRAARVIRGLRAQIGGGDTAIRYLEDANEKLQDENLALRSEVKRKSSDFTFWVGCKFVRVGDRLQVNPIDYPVVMNREQAAAMIQYVGEIVSQLPTLEQRLQKSCPFQE